MNSQSGDGVRFLTWVTLSCVLLRETGCVSLSNKTTLKVFSYNDNSTSINLSVTHVGFYTNIHGGPSEGHYITVPRHLNVIRADQILFGTNNKPKIISDKSRIVLEGEGPCEITLELFDVSGKPLLFSGRNVNGRHTVDARDCRR
jgi:hypothetical protein